jgi:hypothetical protein
MNDENPPHEQPLLNSKGKPYKNGKKPNEQTLEKLRMMREKAKEKLNEKSQQTKKEKIIYDKVKEKELSKYMIEKNKRKEIVNKLVEQNLDTETKIDDESEAEQEHIVVEKKKKPKKKVVRKIIYESSSGDEEEEIIVKRKPKQLTETKKNYDYQELLKYNSNKMIEDKLLSRQISDYQKSMGMMRF